MSLRQSIMYAVFVTSVVAGWAASPAMASTISDPAGDFLSTYTGPHGADLDVISASGTYLGDRYVFTGGFDGTIGTTAGGVYVFGVDRGQGTARFASFGSAVVFDSVVIVNPFGTSSVRDFIANTLTALSPGAVTFSGANLEVDVGAGLLPSTGYAVDQYTFNLWPRNGLTNINQIADFAPDNSNASVGVAEPASMAMLGTGLLFAAGVRRRTRRSA